jgi:hypothetical protein
MNLWELSIFGIRFLPMLYDFLVFKHTSSYDYAESFKSPIMKEVFHRVIDGEYNVHSLFYILQALTKKDAGMVEGGSKEFAERAAQTFVSLGGKLYLGKPVKKVLVKDNTAQGIELEDGEVIPSDYVIASCDAHHTLYQLLEDKYTEKYFRDRYSNIEHYPLNCCMLFCYKLPISKAEKLPKMMDFCIPEMDIAGMKLDHLTVRNHSYDRSINKTETTMTVLVPTKDFVYSHFASLSKPDYHHEKNQYGQLIRKELMNYYHLQEEDITLIDVTTPLTYERYNNAYRGSYMSFITTEHSKGLMRPGLVKGLKNFVIAGQWLMAPGGLPIAVFTDGFEYHKGRVADDSVKREAIRRSGKYRVWGLSFADVEAALDKHTSDYYLDCLKIPELPSENVYSRYVAKRPSALVPSKLAPFGLLAWYLTHEEAEACFAHQATAYGMGMLGVTTDRRVFDSDNATVSEVSYALFGE